MSTSETVEIFARVSQHPDCEVDGIEHESTQGV